jgi:hypothetical protein
LSDRAFRVGRTSHPVAQVTPKDGPDQGPVRVQFFNRQLARCGRTMRLISVSVHVRAKAGRWEAAMKNIEEFVRKVSHDVLDVSRQTVEHFGEKQAEQFLLSAADGIAIKFAGCYGQAALMNLVNVQAWGMVKELKWLQLLFLAGNYPLVMSRLRYIWEAMYRSYFVEAHHDSRVRRLGPDEKLSWIESHKPRLDWKFCVGPVLKKLLPLQDPEDKLFNRYHDLWQELNCYNHPSQYLQERLVDTSSLLVADNFDAAWAEDTLLAGRMVADLVWLALLSLHERAVPILSDEKFHVDCPLTHTLIAVRASGAS